MNSSTNLSYIFEEWTGITYLTEYFLLGVMCLFLTSIAGPLWFFFYVYLSAFVVLIYEKTNKLKGQYDRLHSILTCLWDTFGRVWHGYELHGTENIPDGPGLLIYYHAAIPLDYIFFMTRLFLLTGKQCYSVVDRFTFKLPGLTTLLNVLGMMPGTKDECLCILKEGYLLSISPGGTREAQFSDETYKILWGKRKGFAQIAIDAKVPIIPMFTQNVREGYRTAGKTGILRKLYEYLRWPIVFIYGGWPVKWRTYVGEPIPYDPDITVEELAKKAKIALQSLIDKHQRRPGSIRRALLERFNNHSYAKND